MSPGFVHQMQADLNIHSCIILGSLINSSKTPVVICMTISGENWSGFGLLDVKNTIYNIQNKHGVRSTVTQRWRKCENTVTTRLIYYYVTAN